MSKGPDFPLDPSDLLLEVLVPKGLKRKTSIIKIGEKTLKNPKYMFHTKIISYIKFYKDITHKVYNLL